MSSGQRAITLRFLAEPGDVNFGGKVHGGAVMKWIDLAAYACSAGWSGKYCITAYAGGIRFVAPIHVGNLVEVSAKVIYTGTSSMHIAIDVQASDPKELKNQLTTHCIVIMVAVDEQGKPTPIPEWVPQTAEDIALRQSAIRLMNMRKEIGEEMEAHVKYLK
ncbi:MULTISPECIES: acyl-CoA thioesterase [Vibrio]|jgi:acyl-CoA hydrolase|uniref:acyl-CoA thioesterase n=1 Tax=Vibrio TaxID=662 RepID=UPI00024830FC|nr:MULTISPECIES: acyl-CoA thioesterase [Vibrio]NAW89784.1 acyl-CoA thioesterase [Vibrio sp. V24_P1S3T111]NAW99689.1 acyl-CoA thioesterase [Vibrio sp. V23_P3S9T160]OEE78607.1 acyl-CoA thioesterase [Vibrio ordalii FF-167]OXX19669.1 acyl-CoA thioesterase [Vibrio sp. V05_P4A8T149]OXX24157.1 acyl-CoA thioesterase [Vibrio sp. V06_P1A73T115]